MLQRSALTNNRISQTLVVVRPLAVGFPDVANFKNIGVRSEFHHV